MNVNFLKKKEEEKTQFTTVGIKHATSVQIHMITVMHNIYVRLMYDKHGHNLALFVHL